MPQDATSRLGDAMRSAGLDALLCLSPENVAYTAGFVVPSQPLMRWRHAATVLGADGAQAMVCVDMEETTVRGARPGLDVRVWAEFGGSAMAVLAGLISDLGLAGGRLGIELGYLPVRDHAELLRLLPGARLVAADDLLARCRQVKTPGEIELLTRLSRISDQAIRSACDSVAAGSSEMDLAAALTRSVYAQGAQQFKLMIVATGERSELPNVNPSERILRDGDVCRIEIFSVIDGYHAGVCRTAIVGDPPPRAGQIYQNLAACKKILLDTIGPGVQASAVYRCFRAKFDELGMTPIAFVGHGIGVDLHEAPYLKADATDRLEAGMVFGVEPLVYRTGHGFGMQIKDMVAVTGDGCRLLSDVTSTDEPLRIAA
ncbi:MAG: M24 family metallopeptidase [Streptosporangiaceae bacterium]